MRAFYYCNNCGKSGHSYHNCKIPITSNGVIAFRQCSDERQYLMICRKDSLGYIEFLRGRYSATELSQLTRLFDEMTIDERTRVQEAEFKTLWTYRHEEAESMEKFQALKRGITVQGKQVTIASLAEQCTTTWETPEWGFPKGRRERQERDIVCALREFEEETGYNSNDLNIINNVVPYEEIFMGSNLKSYKHKYYRSWRHVLGIVHSGEGADTTV